MAEYSNWLSDDEYAKLEFHVRGAFMKLWESMDLKYGYQVFKVGFVEACWEICEDAMLVARGQDRVIRSRKIR